MNAPIPRLTLSDWAAHYVTLRQAGLRERSYGGPLERHVPTAGNRRLEQLRFDPSPAALQLWNFLLTENERLRAARARGDRLIGTMKDLGTVPVLAYALPGVRAFYPDGAWWTPCLMACHDGLLEQASALGIDDSFCPVRAMLGAFQSGAQFPIPDHLVCSTGAVCDDFSAVARRLEGLGFPIFWWEIPRRRQPEPGEPWCTLPGGLRAPRDQVTWTRQELARVAVALAGWTGRRLTRPRLRAGIQAANRIRRELRRLRQEVYGTPAPGLPALEMQIAEMLAVHYCSDREECLAVLRALREEVRQRHAARRAVVTPDAVGVFWVNPVADLRAMNLLEDLGGRIAGTDYLFLHALDPIPEHVPPLEALARAALADPMVGSATQRAARITADCRRLGAEALVVSRIPGASHCAHEGRVIQDHVRDRLGLPTIELEIPSLSDAMERQIAGRLEALLEAARSRRPASPPARRVGTQR